MRRVTAFITGGVIAAAVLFLSFVRGPLPPAPKLPPAAVDEPAVAGTESVVLAGGCFWGMQAVFQHVRGVTSVTAGYAGGAAIDANYDAVSTGATGHAESVRVVYDPAHITLGTLLRVYFSVAHDPTELDRQGPDVGNNYRSVIFYDSPEQLRIARDYIRQLTAAKMFHAPIVTELTPLTPTRNFYPAEAYHQDYVQHHPGDLYVRLNDLPKITALEQEWPRFYRQRR